MSLELIEAAGVEDDLVGHYMTIVAGGQPAAAGRFLDRYEALGRRLCEWPDSGYRYADENARTGLIRVGKMSMPFHNFRVFYRPTDTQVVVLAVLHGAMSETSIRRHLRSRSE